MRPLHHLTGLVILAVLCAAVVAGPVGALGWTVTPSAYGTVTINRNPSVDGTGSTTWGAYYRDAVPDYTNGSTWWSTAQWTLLQQVAFPAVTYMCQVEYPLSGHPYWLFLGPASERVAVVREQALPSAVAATGTVPVSLAATVPVSVAQTVPVSGVATVAGSVLSTVTAIPALAISTLPDVGGTVAVSTVPTVAATMAAWGANETLVLFTVIVLGLIFVAYYVTHRTTGGA